MNACFVGLAPYVVSSSSSSIFLKHEHKSSFLGTQSLMTPHVTLGMASASALNHPYGGSRLKTSRKSAVVRRQITCHGGEGILGQSYKHDHNQRRCNGDHTHKKVSKLEIFNGILSILTSRVGPYRNRSLAIRAAAPAPFSASTAENRDRDHDHDHCHLHNHNLVSSSLASATIKKASGAQVLEAEATPGSPSSVSSSSSSSSSSSQPHGENEHKHDCCKSDNGNGRGYTEMTVPLSGEISTEKNDCRTTDAGVSSSSATASPSPASAAAPSLGSSCEGGMCGNHGATEIPDVEGPIGVLLNKIIRMRDSLRLSIVAAVLLAVSFTLALVKVPPAVWKAVLAVSLFISSLPAIIDSLISVFNRVINVDVMMTLAAILSIFSGNPFEGALLMALYSLSHSAEIAVTQRARGDLDALQDLAPSVAYRMIEFDENYLGAIDVSTLEKIRSNGRSRSSSSISTSVSSDSDSLSDSGYSSDEAAPVTVASDGNGKTKRKSGFRSNQYQKVAVDDVKVGDYLLVRTGELAPCDGIVVLGTPFVSMEHITGEAEPRSMEIGNEIPAGARAIDGFLVLRVLRTGAESTVSRMVRLVTEAQQNRPRLQGFLDRFGRAYSQVIVSLSFAIAIFLPIVAKLLHWNIGFTGAGGSFGRGLGFLVAASPCALLIGAPVAYLSALSACARKGVLVKGGARTIEAVSTIQQVIFDKTGTLTTGDPLLLSIDIYPETKNANTNAFVREILSVTATLEGNTVHPIARAILNEAEKVGVDLIQVGEYEFVSGQGLSAMAVLPGYEDGVSVRFGRVTFLKSFDGLTEAQKTWLDQESELAVQRGESVAAYASGKGDVALFRFVDQPRPDASEAMSEFKKRGFKTGMLTGDRRQNAHRVANTIGGVDEVWAEMKPEEKLQMISQLNKSGKHVLYIGDGINDGPALAAATAGASMGLASASATAVHASDIIIMRQQLMDVVWFHKKSVDVQRIVKQNVIFGLALMILAATPALMGALPLWLAVTLHEGSTVLVGLNGLRLLSDRLSSLY